MYDMFLNEEHDMLRQTVRRFCHAEVAAISAKWAGSGALHGESETRTHIRPLIEKMGKLGFLGICLPVRYGGAGMDYLALAVLCEELERIDSFLRVVASVHIGLNSMTIFQWGNEAQKQKYSSPKPKANCIGAYGLTRARNSGTDAGAMTSTARRDGDHYILNGEKIWISLSDVADTFVVFAKTDPSKGNRGISCFIVERGMPGFSSVPAPRQIGRACRQYGRYRDARCTRTGRKSHRRRG
jgi:alkylation response protein AidB-like acyl-CoA dehydrogenase